MNKSKHKAPSPPEIYIDEEGTLVVVGYESYRKVSWVDVGRAIPAKWEKLEVVHSNGKGKITAAITPTLSTDGLGAILTYSTTGHNKPCGQTVGANGSGDFAMLIYGAPEEAWKLARDHIKRMERDGYKIKEALIVPNDEGYSGPFITTVQAPNNEHMDTCDA